jgi:arsenate reductase
MDSTAAVTIYHNPRCGKSRDTLALLCERGVEPTVVEYLKTPPGAAELRAILDKLGMKPEALLRKGEEVFKTQFAGRVLSDAEWIDAMVANPILIERPIVVRGARAVIGRPPQRVVELL